MLLTIDIQKLKKTALKDNSCGKRARNKLEVLQKYNFCCSRCNCKTGLTLHHTTRLDNIHRRDAASYHPRLLTVLCSRCHELEHKR
jgi:hypothetical protein